MEPELAASLATAASRLTFADIPSAAIAQVKPAIVDAIGCILSGIAAEGTMPLRRVLELDGGAADALVFGTARRLPAGAAALINGTAAHALDFDDTSPAWFGHPSVSLVPAIFAIGEKVGASGRDLIAAYVAAYEATACLGRRVNPSHYLRGWHATGTMGTIAAAIAAGKLLGLTVAQLTAAIGIAASQAAGLRENFGTDVKPLHAGLAARAGVLAAQLAGAGMNASASVLEGDVGFIRVYSDPSPGVPAEDFFLRGGFELSRSGISLKPYPCCGAIHTSLDALFALQLQHGFAPADVAGIACTVNKMSEGVLVYPVATTPLEAKFSLHYCLAVALLDGACGLPQFEPERVADRTVQALARRVALVVDDSLAPGITPSTVTVTLTDGRVFTRHAAKPKGAIENPMSVQEVREKFLGCAAMAVTATAAHALFDGLDRLETADDIRTLLPLLAGRH